MLKFKEYLINLQFKYTHSVTTIFSQNNAM